MNSIRLASLFRVAIRFLSTKGLKRPPRNEEIRASMVMLIGKDNQRTGPLKLSELLSTIDRNRHDLLLVNSSHHPPLVKLLDKSVEFQKRQALEVAATFQRHRTRLKEIRFTTTMASHDLETRWKSLRAKLQDAYRVRLVVMEGGMLEREALGKQLLQRLKEEMGKDLMMMELPVSQAGHFSTTFYLASAKPPLERKRDVTNSNDENEPGGQDEKAENHPNKKENCCNKVDNSSNKIEGKGQSSNQK